MRLFNLSLDKILHSTLSNYLKILTSTNYSKRYCPVHSKSLILANKNMNQ